jgi:acetyltransferase-like isoleucine patch superfamily enzyme
MISARGLTQAAPSIRWRLGQVATNLLYKRAFKAIGTGTVIAKPLVLRGVERISLGKDCAVYEGSWLAAETGGRLTVGDGVYMGHDVHVHAVDDITIGHGTSLTDGVLISNGEHDVNDFSVVRGSGPIVIGARCFFGQRAMVLGGVTIGDGARIGAGAVVTRDIPAGATAAGVPARIISSKQSAEF